MQIQIARVDTCQQPSYIVGFAIQHESGKSVYLDAFVPLDSVDAESTSQEVLVAKAYESIKSSVEAFKKECDVHSSSVVGKKFDPESNKVV